ncbi:TPA: hypothetical protein PO752_000768 [Escherichia coli]|nr:hypothetical protein [Escherichia coli]
MTNEELQAIALSMLERQREKVHQQRESLLNPSPFTRPNDWSLKHSWTNTHGGLNQAKPDHQADSSQFVLLFNKTDKNHQRGSVRHYSALLYE